MRRIGLKLAVPCIFFPTIHGHTESIQFPQSGHAEFLPFRIVEIHPVEIRRPLIQMLDKFKFPFPVEREESVRLRFIGGIRLFLILICEKRGSRLQPVYVVYRRRFPRQCRCGGGTRRQCGEARCQDA